MSWIVAKEKRPASTAANVPAVPKPSSSVMLVSPTNQLLLLHRVQRSSAFPSAHVFPGGNLSSFHEVIPSEQDVGRHNDGYAYRLAAIRETFEESGILLARKKGTPPGGPLLKLSEAEIEDGRKAVHGDKIKFEEWLDQKGGVAEIESLVPFTRWITPPNVPKRFTTQMYVYMLPLNSDAVGHDAEVTVHNPTHDGGIEHTAAAFDDCADWLKRGKSGEIIIYPPQMYLIGHLAEHLTGPGNYGAQRDSLKSFLASSTTGRSNHATSSINWADKVISPVGRGVHKASGKQILSLEGSGPELRGSGRAGDFDRVVLVKGTKAGPRNVEVVWRDDVAEDLKSAVMAPKDVKAKL
ncbi:hypothetical protein CcaverHIS002_0600330 [Cutaneotrichosporon cavernicola]|uniref:Nudix hydrolase domain-containing protein n=1 Tax=Cutaneotrichosporon cavernicola TaxID=279322 RepID=A0AA48QWF6_9TREE|nr:uncharacterized protein CcaverHIS019_0500420 [Cutaneotrichosporon cavernicola]BEI85746.1 hypothetical protein CcaverHIS002_0600330 [Cutaneotrichosporon cavernicola]BEI92414.1 hypothetical protein CcaverHIS019_0500420 [Cutaneotrichosporon cavernicola]BEJ00187.1 hypothetical protein CcaverHIS631_0500440 [Cutaneotrichosporon cavernicola]BEJ07958.1 hypothetical protein CcaverHIS641_0500430 [Cutaneotrichosporon cavernicola]